MHTIGEVGIVALWMFGLFLTCCIYAVWLESLKKAYEPNWTWATVVGGVGFITLALGGIELCGVRLHFWLIFLADVVGAIPIVAWQFWQWSERLKRKNGNGHAPTYEGSQGSYRAD